MPVQTQNPDLGVFSQYKGFNDYNQAAQAQGLQSALMAAKIQQAQQANQIAQQKALAGGDLPAALQLANEFQKRQAAGDVEGANLIREFAKSQDKGIYETPEGVFQPLQGYGAAVGTNAAIKSGMEEAAKLGQQAVFKPAIEADVASAKVGGKAEGEKAALFKSSTSRLPELNATVERLSELGKKATFTKAGQLKDIAARQFGISTEGGVAATEYKKTVDNVVLPLLRDTFGAAFTAAEGDSLRATLGASDLTPEEKDATLKAFIDNKYNELQSLGRELGVESNLPERPTFGNVTPTQEQTAPKLLTPADLPKVGTVKGGYVFVGGDPSMQKNWKKK